MLHNTIQPIFIRKLPDNVIFETFLSIYSSPPLPKEEKGWPQPTDWAAARDIKYNLLPQESTAET